METEVLGFIAGMITTISFVPQVVRIYRIKSGRDISLWMMLLFALGVTLWLIYGLLLSSLPIILANAVTLVLVVAILVLKIYYARNQQRY
ncbi:MAG TPA: SemiSWEET transporter [Turneriella sp.]|nr:SemiSWEET transporter [Turneriella sp.]HNE20023.1 SemiSWEET transporter [Turneriella sp.]HNL10442.1 SemiSWEET transporter [Turneriella sp.]HNL53710.1 SemiSWEET transporter [Turneriella sp.]HNN00558.1 SemiSWEET transporter [Turneriella sp.]